MSIDNINMDITFFGIIIPLVFAALFYRNAKKAEKLACTYEVSTEVLSKFYRDADKIISDPASSKVIKTVLAEFAIMLAHKETGKRVFDSFFDNFVDDLKNGSIKQSGQSKFTKELKALEKSRPDLVTIAKSAANNGTMAMLLIYGQEHPNIQIDASRIALDPKKTDSFVKNVVSNFDDLYNKVGAARAC